MGFFDVIAGAFRGGPRPAPPSDDADVEMRTLEREAAEGDAEAELRLARLRERRDGAAKALDRWTRARLQAVNGARRYSVLAVKDVARLVARAVEDERSRLYLVPDGAIVGLEDESLDDDSGLGNDRVTVACAVRDESNIALGLALAERFRPYPERAWPGITWRDRVTPTPPPERDEGGNPIPRPEAPKPSPESRNADAAARAAAWARAAAPDRTRFSVEVARRWLLLRSAPGGVEETA